MHVPLPDPDWYFAHVLDRARPGTNRLAAPTPGELWRSWWRAQAGRLEAAWPQATRHGFVLTTGELAPRVSRQRARSAVRKGRWTQAAHGIVSPLDVRDDNPHLERRRRHALAAAGAALRQPAHVVSARSAAIVHGLPVFALPARPEMTDPERNGLGQNGAKHVRGAALSPADITTWYGVNVTSVARTLVDLARHDRRDAIMAADAALRDRLVTRAQIDEALAEARGWPGVRQAREVLALADPRAESPLESLTRLVLHDDGFPPPELQVWIGGDRVDMLFDKQRLILEIDGLEKYATTDPQDEKRRERRLRRHGYRIERLTWDEVVNRWPQTRIWLRAELGLPV